MKQKSYLIFLLIVILAVSCNDRSAIKKYGIEFNRYRKEAGLPLLDSSWKLIDNLEGSLKWSPGIFISNKVIYRSKLVKIRHGIITREENYFVGKKKYSTVDGNFEEEVYISCDFNGKGKFDRWSCEYKGPGNEFGRTVSRLEADSILNQWGYSGLPRK